MGWLNAFIELKNDKTERPKESRLMRCNANNTPAPFVELTEGGYLLSILMEAGPIKSSPMGGVQSLDWGDLSDYNAIAGAELESWEAKLVYEMSDAFFTGMNEGTNPFSIPPADRKN